MNTFVLQTLRPLSSPIFTSIKLFTTFELLHPSLIAHRGLNIAVERNHHLKRERAKILK
jgi:hypothetical protein